ncbi:Hsp20/alpha crystallin family protein [Sphingomonas sp.]|uniref:Hsp20/alpha crystallin family protein n=1 Tax=Sphingomonas sp. TaxID=28214 RepID=UPI0025EFADE3|nr:Hsp20/alpha crystallin family protein [Sphingomonas sp.]
MNEITKPIAARQTPASPFLDQTPMTWLRGEIDRLFEDFGQPARGIFNFGSRGTPVPPMELVDAGDSYRLTAELPGMTDKDVTIELTAGVLSIAGEKSESKDGEEGGCLMSERRYGAFSRQITLPKDADRDSVSASFKNGLLTVTIGKDQKAAAEKRTIAIKA